MDYPIEKIATIVGATPTITQHCTIAHLSTDSRTVIFPTETLFFALKTQKNDGAKYIPELYRKGVRNFVVSEPQENVNFFPDNLSSYCALPDSSDANFLIVNNVFAALQQLAAYHRQQFQLPVIAITGSNGKTVVKELLYQLIHSEFNIVRSPRSYNSQIGVPLTLWQINEQHDLAIVEVGISQPHEMNVMVDLVSPNIGLITNIGTAHQENFNSLEQKCTEKLKLFKHCQTIVYNADYELIKSTAEKMYPNTTHWRWSRIDPDNQLFIENVRQKIDSSEIHCIYNGQSYTFEVPFIDEASIENVIHCIALIFILRPEIATNLKAFRQLEAVAMRLEAKEGINNCQLINDTYNSDIQSLRIALDFLQTRKGNKKLKTTVILSDILQSGLSNGKLYKKVAALLQQKNVDKIIGIGRGLQDSASLFDSIAHREFYATTEDFLSSPNVKNFSHELILLKGSRVFRFERITKLLEKKVHETVLEVDLDALVYNYNYFRERLNQNTKITCMVKAFGYGIGSYETAKTLQDHRCDYLAVAVADEGVALRTEGISMPIIVMNPDLKNFSALVEYNLEPEIYSFNLLDALLTVAVQYDLQCYPVHIKVDTGMCRLGFNPDEVLKVCQLLKNQHRLRVRSVFSHLAGSDSPQHDQFTLQQIEKFKAAAQELENELGYKIIKHVLNSAGSERFPDYQLDMVRLGIALYGISAGDDPSVLQPVCTLKTSILQIRNIQKGTSVGYGRKSVVERDSRIAVIPVGYADGLDRHLGCGTGEVIIHGKRYPTIGNICMDLTMVDVTGAEAQEGDEVIVFGKELTVSEIAKKLDTIPYEILTSVSSRVKRICFKE